jgi:hypothetical protein
MKALARHGFRDGKYRVPEALEDDPRNMTLVEKNLKGGSLYDRIFESDIRPCEGFH